MGGRTLCRYRVLHGRPRFVNAPGDGAIIGPGKDSTAVAAFRAQYRLKTLQQSAAALWKEVDALLVPTAGTIYRVAEVEAKPVELNSNLGHYTNFVNLLDMAAIAVPAGFGTTDCRSVSR